MTEIVGALNNAVLDRGNAQGTELPWFTRFGDELAPRRARSICAGAQFGLKLVEEPPFPNLGADAPHGHPVDPGGSAASVRGHASPTVTKHAQVSKPTPHVPPTVVGIRLAPLVEFALNAEYPSLIGLAIRVHRSFLRHTSLPSSLRHVRGFPALRLLRKLRPRSRPFPAVAASPVPIWADDPSSRVPIRDLMSLGGELYPWRCGARVIESWSRAERAMALDSEDINASPFLIAVPPVPSHRSEAV